MEWILTVRRAFTAMLILIVSSGCLLGSAYFESEAGTFRLGNDYLERVFAREGDTIRTSWLVNKVTGHTWPVVSAEFQIRFTYERVSYWTHLENPVTISSTDCVYLGHETGITEDGDHQLILKYAWSQELAKPPMAADRDSPGLQINVTYVISNQRPVMHKRLGISCKAGPYYFLEQVSTENMRVGGLEVSHQGFGQPIYGQEMFFGLEYPAGNNLVREDGRLMLFHQPGKAAGIDGVETYPSVWGVAEDGRTRAAFLRYVDQIRVSPVKPFLLYNTWYDLRTAERAMGREGGLLNLENSLQRVEQLQENLVDHGFELHSFVLDEGWDKYTPLWEIDEKNFPGGFAELSAALEKINSGLGLWYGPIGGYGEGLRLRGERGREMGLEVTHKGYLNHAGPKYGKIFKESLLGYMEQYDVNYYKLDGMVYGYADSDHSMLPGIYSREAQTESLTALLADLHQVNPDIFINLTTSQWLSPWWLMHSECVYLGGGDFGWLRSLPSPSKRDLAISFRDKMCYEKFKRHDQQFPLNSIMTVGVIKGEYELLGELDETLDKWTNNLVMHFGRGVSMWELYLTPHVLKEEEWRTLRSSISWALHNQKTLLANTTMVGGDPSKRQPYGYFHQSPEKMILIVRNPYISPVNFTLKLNYENGWLEPNSDSYLPVTAYPYNQISGDRVGYGDDFALTLAGYETRVIEFHRNDQIAVPLIRRGRLELSGDSTVAYWEAGQESLLIENPTEESFVIAGKTLAAGSSLEMELPETRADAQLEIEDARTEFQRRDDSGLSGELRLELPAETRDAVLAFMVEGEASISGVTAILEDAGGSMECSREVGEDENWYFFVVKLDTVTSHRVSYRFEGADEGALGKLSAWLIYHRTLPGETLSLAQDPEWFLLPAESSLDRRVECLFERPVRF